MDKYETLLPESHNSHFRCQINSQVIGFLKNDFNPIYVKNGKYFDKLLSSKHTKAHFFFQMIEFNKIIVIFKEN